VESKVDLKHPIDVMGQPRSELRFRHELRMGDLAAVQRYARRHGLTSDVGELLGDGDYGAILALVESLCQLPAGTCDQIHPDDLAAVLEAAGPFLAASPATGGKPSAPSP
jgi:hypothetical protein